MTPLIFGHSLLQQLGGQLQTAPGVEIEKYLPSFMATRSRKPV
ncbi:hypothetical protein [Alcaligenes faecalis]|nr:hypothetical protein [Alcaligenes faecalis]